MSLFYTGKCNLSGQTSHMHISYEKLLWEIHCHGSPYFARAAYGLRPVLNSIRIGVPSSANCVLNTPSR